MVVERMVAAALLAFASLEVGVLLLPLLQVHLDIVAARVVVEGSLVVQSRGRRPIHSRLVGGSDCGDTSLIVFIR